jgi:hypothetical protein
MARSADEVMDHKLLDIGVVPGLEEDARSFAAFRRTSIAGREQGRLRRGTFQPFYYKLAVMVRYKIAIAIAEFFTLAGCARLDAIRDCQVEYPLPAPGYAVAGTGPAGSAFLYVPGNGVVLNPGESVEGRSAEQYACIAQAQKAHPVFQ